MCKRMIRIGLVAHCTLGVLALSSIATFTIIVPIASATSNGGAATTGKSVEEHVEAEGAMSALIEALKDEKLSVRRDAALALGELRDEAAIDPLIKALKKARKWEFRIRPGSVQESMRLALLKIGEVNADPFIMRLKTGDAEVRVIVLGLLAKLKTTKAVDFIIPLLKDDHWGVRGSAADVLGMMGDKRAVEPLIATLKDKEQWVRISAARSLGMIADKRAVEPLISLLNDDKAVSAAASALGEIKDKRASNPLVKCLKHENPWMRDCSAEALGKMKDVRAVEPLIAILKVTKPLYDSRTQPKMPDEAHLRALREILGDERRKRRHRVAWALAEIGKPSIGPLTDAVQNDEGWLSGAAAAILERIRASLATEPSGEAQSRQPKVERH